MTKPKIVFVDTEQFDARSLSFSHSHFTRLMNLVESGQVKVLLTDVVVGEVKRHIREKFRDARKTLGQQFGGLFRNLVKTPSPPILSSEYWENAESEVLAEFENCCKKLKVEMVPIVPEHVSIVFGWYFKYEGPFDSHKRKAEFPDAFSIAAITEWAKKHGEHVYMVSRDMSFRVASELGSNALQLTHKDSLEAFFELFPDPTLAATIKVAFATFLNDEANYAFGENEFQQLGFYVEDAEGWDAHCIAVTYTKPDCLHVVEAKDGHAVLAGGMHVDFMVDICGIQSETEDKSAFVTAEIKIDYDVNDPTKIDVKSVQYDKKGAIGVSLPSSLRRIYED